MTDAEADVRKQYAECAGCHEHFDLECAHVAYGGLLWCTEQCLAEYTVENDLLVDRVAAEMEHRSTTDAPLDGGDAR